MQYRMPDGSLNLKGLLGGVFFIAVALSPLLTLQGIDLQGDDVLFARLARDMAGGSPSFFINTHTCRLGFIAPMALLYYLFGIHDWVALIQPVLSSVGIIVMATYCAYRIYGMAAAFMAALFAAFNPMLYRFGTVVLSDIQAAFFYAAFITGWLLLVTQKSNRLRLWGAVTGVCYAWALITRPSMLPIMLATLALFIYFCRKKVVEKHFPIMPFFMGCLAVGVPYLIYLYIHTGNPFYFIEALIGGYHVPEAPWLPPLYGIHYWMRLTGLTITLSAIEGYLFASFPLVVFALFLRRSPYWNSMDREHDYLLVAIAAPLLVLSHLSTSLIQWVPVLRLDLRLGFPLILPVAVLAAGVCSRLTGRRFSSRVTRGFLVAIACFGFIAIGAWYKGNAGMMFGAGAAAFVVLAWLFSNERSWLVAGTLVIFLVAAWGQFHTGEYVEKLDKNMQLRLDAASVPWERGLPIVTDALTAQYLPYLRGFSDAARIVSWQGSKGKRIHSPWVEDISAPLPKPYIIVWYPKQAFAQAERWRTGVPSWIVSELLHAKLLNKLGGDLSDGENSFPAKLEAGVYMANGYAK